MKDSVHCIVASAAVCAFALSPACGGSTTPPEGVTLEDLTNPDGKITTTTAGNWIKPAKNAFDNGTKHNNDDRSIHDGKTVDWIYTFEEPTKVNAYKVYVPGSASGCETRMPRTWSFEAKNNDDAEWKTLDVQLSETGWNKLESRYYAFVNNTAYDSYRFAVTDNNNGDNYIQIDELEYFFVNLGNPIIGSAAVSRSAEMTYSVSATMYMNAAETLSWIAFDGVKAITNAFDHSVAEGASGQGTISGLDLEEDKTYLISVLSENANGSDEKVAGVVYTGNLALGATTDADEYQLVPGTVTVSRADAAPWPLVVNYTIATDASGSAAGAVEGATWAAPEPITIAAGQTTGFLLVKPKSDSNVKENISVIATLASGDYEIPPTASATLSLINLAAPPGYNTWISPTNSLASITANWSLGHAPTDFENVLFDGNFTSANCEWDADATPTVASWTMRNDYNGVVTLNTVFPGKGDFQCLTVTGAMVVDSGTITHPQSRTMGDNHPATWDWVGDLIANETYRLRLDVGSLTVGAGGMLDAKGKGYLATHDSARVDASHGGRLTANSPRCYGDPKKPIHIGLPDRAGGNYYNGVGGGAIYVTSKGAIVVNGVVRADSDARQYNNNNHCCGAAGSVYLQAASVSGTGTISAYGPGSAEGNNKGTGGRVALVTEQPVDRSTFASINAGSARRNAQNSRATRSGGSGTVFFKDASQTYGTLLVDNVDGSLSPAVNRSVTEPSTDGDWTFDALGLGNYAIIAIPVGTALHLPNGLSSVFSLNSPESTAYGSIRYEGGTLDLGSSTDQTMSGSWMLTPWTNLTVNADLTVKGGAAVGVPAMADIFDNGSTLPTYVSCNLTVSGNMTVESDGTVVAKGCGLKKDTNSMNNGFKGVLPGHTHGGRCLFFKNLDAQRRYYTAFDSVFAPHLPGLSVPYPNGQGAESSGGVITLVVSGALKLDGEVNANGMLETYKDGANCSGGTGGAIDITAGSLSGSGTIMAEAGSKQAQRGSGGRVAVKLTGAGVDFSNFAGKFSASGRARSPGSYADSSAGTVYLQTAVDGEKGGTVYIAMSEGNRYANNTNTTEMVSLGYGGDSIPDYKKVKYVISDYGRGAVNTNFAASTVTIADANSSLDLEGNKLTVKSAKINGVKLATGTYSAGSTLAIGERTLGDYLVDSVGGGSLVVSGGGMTIRLR